MASRGFDESDPVCFNVIIMYFWSEATQHLIRKGSFHCDRLIPKPVLLLPLKKASVPQLIAGWR